MLQIRDNTSIIITTLATFKSTQNSLLGHCANKQ
jgi:hypothetical protein